MKGLHQRETATAITDGVAVTPPARGWRGQSPWQLAGPRGAAVEPLWLPLCTEQMQTHCFVPGSCKHQHGVHSDLGSGHGGGEELLQRDERQKDTSFSTARQATELPGPGEGMPPGLSSPSQNTALGISLLSQQIAPRRDSRKRQTPVVFPPSCSLGVVFGVRTAWKNTSSYL